MALQEGGIGGSYHYLEDKWVSNSHTGPDVGLENVTQLLYGVQVLEHCQILYTNTISSTINHKQTVYLHLDINSYRAYSTYTTVMNVQSRAKIQFFLLAHPIIMYFNYSIIL